MEGAVGMGLVSPRAESLCVVLGTWLSQIPSGGPPSPPPSDGHGHEDWGTERAEGVSQIKAGGHRTEKQWEVIWT